MHAKKGIEEVTVTYKSFTHFISISNENNSAAHYGRVPRAVDRYCMSALTFYRNENEGEKLLNRTSHAFDDRENAERLRSPEIVSRLS